ncbi:MAG: hypothetical protein ABI318_06000 [Chthoniobacteraceae bacterium]
MLARICHPKHQGFMPKRSTKKAGKGDINDTVFNVVRAVTGAQIGNPPILTAETDAARAPSKSARRKTVGRKTESRGGK